MDTVDPENTQQLAHGGDFDRHSMLTPAKIPLKKNKDSSVLRTPLAPLNENTSIPRTAEKTKVQPRSPFTSIADAATAALLSSPLGKRIMAQTHHTDPHSSCHGLSSIPVTEMDRTSSSPRTRSQPHPSPSTTARNRRATPMRPVPLSEMSTDEFATLIEDITNTSITTSNSHELQVNEDQASLEDGLQDEKNSDESREIDDQLNHDNSIRPRFSTDSMASISSTCTNCNASTLSCIRRLSSDGSESDIDSLFDASVLSLFIPSSSSLTNTNSHNKTTTTSQLLQDLYHVDDPIETKRNISRLLRAVSKLKRSSEASEREIASKDYTITMLKEQLESVSSGQNDATIAVQAYEKEVHRLREVVLEKDASIERLNEIVGELEEKLLEVTTRANDAAVEYRRVERAMIQDSLDLRQDAIRASEEISALHEKVIRLERENDDARTEAREARERELMVELRAGEAIVASDASLLRADVAEERRKRAEEEAHQLRETLDHCRNLLERQRETTQTYKASLDTAQMEAEERVLEVTREYKAKLDELETKYQRDGYEDRYRLLAEENSVLRAQLLETLTHAEEAKLVADKAKQLVVEAQAMRDKVACEQDAIKPILDRAREANEKYDALLLEVEVAKTNMLEAREKEQDAERKVSKLVEEITHLEHEAEDREEVIAQREKDIVLLESELDAANAEGKSLTEKLSALQEDQDDLRCRYQTSVNEGVETRRQLTEANAETERVRDMLSASEANIATMSAQIATLKQSLEDNAESIRSLEQVIHEREGEIETLHRSIDAKSHDVMTANEQLVTERRVAEGLRKDLADAIAREEATRCELDQSESLNDRLKRDVVELEAKLTASVAACASTQEHAKELSLEKSTLEAMLRQAETTASISCRDDNGLKIQLSRAKEEADENARALQSSKEMVRKLESELTEATVQLAALQARRTSSNGNNSSSSPTNTGNGSSDFNVIEMEELRSELERTKAAHDKYREEAMRSSAQVDVLTEEVERLTSRVGLAKDRGDMEVQTLTQLLEESERCLRTLQSQIADAETKVMEGEQAMDKLRHERDAAIEACEKQKREGMAKYTLLEEERLTMKEKMKEVDEMIKVREEEVRQREQEVAVLQRKLDRLVGAKDTDDELLKLKTTLIEKEKVWEAERSSMEASLHQLREEVSNLKAKVANKDEDHGGSVDEQVRRRDKKIDILQQQNAKLKSFVLDYKQKGDQRLQDVTAELQGEKDLRRSLVQKMGKIKLVLSRHKHLIEQEQELVALLNALN